MMRRYLAFADTGKNYIDFEFFSEYRANSKANLKDAEKHYKKMHGHCVKVCITELLKY